MSNQRPVATVMPALTFAQISENSSLWTKEHDLFLYDLIKRGNPTKVEETTQIIKHELQIAFPYIFNESHPVNITRLEAAIRLWSSNFAPPREIVFNGQVGQDAKIAWLNSSKVLNSTRTKSWFGD
ncbi:MAG: hypothetical protein M1812_000816 [Candelaria pacifica]|nr:MAG: hypothetical protein M1812_000816 [Candelaria pacifica]